MKFSVVIPAYNGASFLKSNLPAVFQLKAAEVILVDDASSDNTSDFVLENFPQIKFFHHSNNKGFPYAANYGFTQASGDIVILLNQDVNPRPDLIKVVRPFFKEPFLFAVTFNESNRSWAKARMANGWLEYENGDSSFSQHPSLWASGGSAAFRKSIWDSLGGFDQSFSPGYLEDLDLGYRAHKRGYHILWVSNARVSHTPESTFSHLFPASSLVRFKDRNYLIAHWKNLDVKNLWIHCLAVLDRILQHPGYIIPAFMALRYLPNMVTFRKSEAKYIKLSDSQVLAKCSA